MQHDLHFSIKSFEDGEDIAVDYKAGQDIIFLDIEMPFMDGMSAAGKIREKDPGVILIFLTNMPQFVIHGYKVEALDYLLETGFLLCAFGNPEASVVKNTKEGKTLCHHQGAGRQYTDRSVRNTVCRGDRSLCCISYHGR